MTKQEFLDNLRVALSGRVGASAVAENIRYYEDYINTQVRMGRSEDEVIQQLGDPRLLAKSIAEANKHAGENQTREEEYHRGSDNNRGYGAYGQEQGYPNRKAHRIPGGLIVFLVVFVGMLVLSAVFSMLSFLAPVLLPLLLIVLLVRFLWRS